MVTRIRMFAALAALTSLTSIAAAGVSEWLPFEIEQGNLLVPVIINGIEARAILDSGERMYMMNERFVQKHGLSLKRGAQYELDIDAGTEPRVSYNDVPINLFGANLELDQFVSVDLGEPTVAVLIGNRFFNQFVFQIDYPNQVLRIIEFDSVDLRKIKNVKARVDESSGLPIVQMTLNNAEKVWLALDTSENAGLKLNRVVATGNGWLDEYDAVSEVRGGQPHPDGLTEVRRGLAATGRYDSFRLPVAKLGPYEVENVLTSVPADGVKWRLQLETTREFSHIKGKRIRGLVGYEVLKHFVVTIDYRREHVHIGVPPS